MNYRICYAIGCEKPVHPEKLMCWGCWKLVPKNLQQAVYQTNRGASTHDRVRACQNARASVNRQRTVKDNPLGGEV